MNTEKIGSEAELIHPITRTLAREITEQELNQITGGTGATGVNSPNMKCVPSGGITGSGGSGKGIDWDGGADDSISW